MNVLTIKRMRRAGIAAVAFAALAATAQATHWPQPGGDPGHSGFQAGDQSALPMKFRWQGPGDDVKTAPIVTAGTSLTDQRVAYGHYVQGAAHIRLLRFSDGVSQFDPNVEDSGTADTDTFGPTGGVSPVEASGHNAASPTELYLIHNDDNQLSRSKNSQLPGPNLAGNDIALAQIEASTGVVVQDVPLGSSNPQTGFNTNGYTIDASPMLGPDEGGGHRTLFFTIRNGATRRLCEVGIDTADANTVNGLSFICSGSIADLNTAATPSLVRMRDPSSSTLVTMVAVATDNGVKTFRTNNLGAAGPSADGLGKTWTPSIPLTATGNPPPTTPFMYVASQAGTGTIVRKLKQDDGNLNDPVRLATLVLAEPDGQSAELSGGPGPGLAVTQLIGALNPEGRVLVTTKSNVYSLDTSNLGAADPPQLFPSDVTPGFSKTAPAASGNLGFATTDAGQQYVFFLTPDSAGNLRVPVEEGGFQPADNALNAAAAVGQPALSHGRVVFAGSNGAFVYGPAIALTAPNANSSVAGANVQLSAHVYNGATAVTFKVDGVVPAGAANVPVTNGDASYTWNSTSVLDGPHAITGETGAGNDVESSAPRTVIVNNFGNPTAALTVSPIPASSGQPVTLNASASAPTQGETETITKWAFEIDGDNDFDDVVETAAEGGDGIVQVVFPTGGSKTVTVRVTDSHGDTATKSVSFRVNSSPTVTLSVSPNPAGAGQPVTLDASGSSDSDGTIAKFEFDLDGDDTFETDNGTSPTLTRAFTKTTTVAVRVSDNEGGSTVAKATLAIASEVVNGAPTAAFTFAPNPAKAGQTVAFNGTLSKDPDGTLTKYEWDFDGDGTFEVDTGAVPVATHVFPSAKIWRVTLRVTDNKGGSATSSQNVIVTSSTACTSRCSPGISASVKPARDRTVPYSFRVSGKLKLPSGVSSARGCTGSVRVRAFKGSKRVVNRRFAVHGNCRFSGRFTVKKAAKKLKVTIRFGGNSALSSRSAKSKTVRAG